MEKPNPAPSTEPSFIEAIALIVVGLLIFVPTGLCTGVLFFGPLVEATMSSRFNGGVSIVPLIIGGPFVFGGGFILWNGVRLLLAAWARMRNHDGD
jgi:hypothetical protein